MPSSSHLRGGVAALVIAVVVGCRGEGDRVVLGDAGAEPGRSDAGARDIGGACIGGGAAGESSPLRRLTAAEYDASVRDIFGISVGPAEGFLPEPSVLAGDGASMAANATEAHAHQLMLAAERVAREAAGHLSALAARACADLDARACVSRLVADLGRRVWRRPLTDAERVRLAAVADAVGAENVVESMQVVLEVMLQSPRFLYRVEIGAPDADAGAALVPLTDHEVATRLSYFLWGTTPDDTLLDAADRGELHTAAQIREHAERMLEDPRARVAVDAFHREWLGYDAVLGLAKDPAAYPDFTATAARTMADETRASIEEAVFDPHAGRFADVLPSLLTQPSLLAVLAHPMQSSPVRRGFFVRDRILCQALPPPPPDVTFDVPDPTPAETTRERFEPLRENAICAGCHERIDPIGYVFEHYDAVGARRDTEAGMPIDSRGLLLGTDVDGEYDDVPALARALGRSQAARGCVVEQWFRWGFGRTASEGDACTTAQLALAFAAGGHRILDLVLAVTQTDAFRYRRAESAGEGACQ